MKVMIRKETNEDFNETELVVKKAFENAEYSDQSEHLLVDKLRKSDAFITELSLVAEVNHEIVGHSLLTKLKIKNSDKEYESLALAPVSILPEYQKQGLGSQLIEESLKIARELGYTSVIVLGHHEYYPKFGFKPASAYGIKAPFEVPNESFMAVELRDGSLENVRGTVVYPPAFNE